MSGTNLLLTSFLSMPCKEGSVMSPKAQVGIYTSQQTSIAVLVLSQNTEDGMSTIAVGQGVKGSAVRTVPTSTIRFLGRPISFDVNSPVVTENCDSSVTPLAQQNLRTHSAVQDDMPAIAMPLTKLRSSASLLQSMVVAPFDSITEWRQPAASIAFIAIAATIFFLKNAQWLFPGLPMLIYQFMNDGSDLEPLLLVIAASLAIAASRRPMDEVFRSTSTPLDNSTIRWRVGALLPLIVVTAVGTIHSNWSPQDQATSLLGRVVRAAYPWLDVSVDEMCLYTIATIAILRVVTGAVRRQ